MAKIVNCFFSIKKGGAERAFVNYGKALIANNHEVFNIIRKDFFLKSELNNNIYEGNFFCRKDFFFKRRLKRILGEIKPDLIIVHATRAMEFINNKLYSDCPILGVFHNNNFKQAKFLDYAAVLTPTMQKNISSHIAIEQTFIIPNMVEMLSSLRQMRIFNFNVDNIVIGTLSRLEHEKGIHIFLEAVASLRNRMVGCNMKVKIAGDGGNKKLLQTMARDLKIEDIVEFCGWVDDVNHFMQKLDIFCLPSLDEPFGIVCLEAFANNKPVIATACDGPLSYIQHRINGLIIPTNNPKFLADAVILLNTQPQFAQMLAKNAYENVHNNYGKNVVNGKIEKMVQNILQNTKK